MEPGDEEQDGLNTLYYQDAMGLGLEDIAGGKGKGFGKGQGKCKGKEKAKEKVLEKARSNWPSRTKRVRMKKKRKKMKRKKMKRKNPRKL
jgi:hypothetical protein